MKIGSVEAPFSVYGDGRYLKMKEFGFDGVDYSLENGFLDRTDEEFEKKVLADKALIDAAGLTVHQVHGPWLWPPHNETAEERAEWMRVNKLTLRLCSLMGSENFVVHPLMVFGAQDRGREREFRDANLAFYRELLTEAKKYGITVCFENMPFPELSVASPEETVAFVREINDGHFKTCFDTGHALVFHGNLADAVRKIGKDLGALHVHDNRGDRDAHMVPGLGIGDFKEFVRALREIGFSGTLSFEVGRFGEFLPDAPEEERLAAFCKIARELAEE